MKYTIIPDPDFEQDLKVFKKEIRNKIVAALNDFLVENTLLQINNRWEIIFSNKDCTKQLWKYKQKNQIGNIEPYRAFILFSKNENSFIEYIIYKRKDSNKQYFKNKIEKRIQNIKENIKDTI